MTTLLAIGFLLAFIGLTLSLRQSRTLKRQRDALRRTNGILQRYLKRSERELESAEAAIKLADTAGIIYVNQGGAWNEILTAETEDGR